MHFDFDLILCIPYFMDNEAKNIIQKMVFAETEDQFNMLYDDLQQMPIDYFDNNWHDCRKEWSIASHYE